MAHIRQIPPEEATGTLKRIYDEAIARAGKVFGILRVQSLNPAALEASMGMYKTIMFPAPPRRGSGAGGPGSPPDAARRTGFPAPSADGTDLGGPGSPPGAARRTGSGPSPLSRARREMLATVVSRANDCFY